MSRITETNPGSIDQVFQNEYNPIFAAFEIFSKNGFPIEYVTPKDQTEKSHGYMEAVCTDSLQRTRLLRRYRILNSTTDFAFLKDAYAGNILEVMLAASDIQSDPVTIEQIMGKRILTDRLIINNDDLRRGLAMSTVIRSDKYARELEDFKQEYHDLIEQGDDKAIISLANSRRINKEIETKIKRLNLDPISPKRITEIVEVLISRVEQFLSNQA